MATLLVLGSKPDPALPDRSCFDDLACANASGRSAAAHALPSPRYTVMSAILTSGHTAANDLAVQALAGLRTETLYFYPRPKRAHGALGGLMHAIKNRRMQPRSFQRRLHAVGYTYEQFAAPGLDHYLDLVHRLCDHDRDVVAATARKLPSTGMVALALGIADQRYARYIVSGFSFEITHAYAANPVIAQQGTAASKHADTDITVLAALSRSHGNLFTTERVVHERTGVPMLEDEVDERHGSNREAAGAAG